MYITVVGLLRVVSCMGLYINLIQVVLSQFEMSRVHNVANCIYSSLYAHIQFHFILRAVLEKWRDYASLYFVGIYFMNCILRLHITAVKNHKTLERSCTDFFSLFYAIVALSQKVLKWTNIAFPFKALYNCCTVNDTQIKSFFPPLILADTTDWDIARQLLDWSN